MAKQKSPETGLVKKETTMIVALVALVVGFLGGIFYSAMQSSPSGPVQTTSGPPQQQQQQPGFSSDQAKRILALEQEVALNPTNVNAWLQLGNIYFDTNSYEKSLELSPNNANVLTDLGVMYRRTGQPQKALDAFDRAMTIAPGHEQSRFNKGIVLRYDLNDREGAIKAWEELLKINPNAMAPNGIPLTEAIKTL